MDLLGRYYTNEIISSLLINSLETKSAGRVLDMGIGNASLTKAAKVRWKSATFYATEVENKKIKEIEKNLSFVKVCNYDSLKSNVKAQLKIKFGSIDVAICNPPYVKVEKKRSYKKLFMEAGIEECLELKQLSSEIVFFAHNLAMLKPNGELGIIVSDSLITGKNFRLFRETILRKCDLKTVIQLPDKIFPNTEARTHILILGKSISTNKNCNLLLVDSNGKYNGKLLIEKSKLAERLDFQFWNYRIGEPKNLLRLKDIGARIQRGHFSSKELRESFYSFFHSTDFKGNSKCLRFTKKIASKYIPYTAKKGDILLCRVGKRAIGKIAKINDGRVIISDCIFQITVPIKYRKKVWQALNSDAGKQWIRAYAHGVCSQVISKCDLENFPFA